jgi:hypothetical protein
MPGSSDMNIVLGQGDALKEVYNVRKQNFEMNQPYIAQRIEQKKKDENTKVQEPPKEDRIEIKHDKDQRKSPHHGDEKEGKSRNSEDSDVPFEDRLIDIKV